MQNTGHCHGIDFSANTVVAIYQLKKLAMPIVKVIEVIASSEKGIEDAIQNALAETSKTVRNIDSIFVKDIKVHVKDNRITTYGLICKVSFRIDDSHRE